jgi:hypothetical protein
VQVNALKTGSWDGLKELKMDSWFQKALKLASAAANEKSCCFAEGRQVQVKLSE